MSSNELISVVKSYRKAFITIGFFTAFINLLMLVPSIYMLQVYDRAIPSGNGVTLLMLTVMALGVYCIMSLLEYVRSMIVINIGKGIDTNLSPRIYTAVYEANLTSGDFDAGNLLRDFSNVRQFITGTAIFAFFDAPWFPVYLFVIFIFNKWLGLFALCGACLLIILTIANEFLTNAPLTQANSLARQSSDIAGANLRNAEVIESMGMLDNFRVKWYDLHQQFINYQCIASNRASKITSLTRFIRLSQQSLVLGLGGWLAIDGYITPGMMIAGSVLMGRTLSPIEQVINSWKSFNSAKISYERLVKLLNEHPKRNTGMTLPPPTGKVTVESLTASPPGYSGEFVLKNISFKIEAGDVLAIVGPSASGKTTLAKFLTGMWPAAEGIVRLDDADIHLWNKDQLGPYIGYLPQNVELFPGTVAENISRFSKLDADKIIHAATMAGVHELISHLPNGYDTLIGNNGAGLSGGQKQRIGLARALYGNPSLVILDEPNSNLDDLGELALNRAIRSLRENKKTVVLITHKTNLLSVTTKLLVLANGRVNLFGDTNEVLVYLNGKRMKRSTSTLTSEVGN
ncbi:peptidase [Klebsiella aerogenes]|uniref:type I secretion system permease/ATPase n=1 Tax=Klebsiella aerogenes TaxID=548 RepID=UPI000735C249|nr:type I secretion system permease/ATPase [Klebsiella aerogenes]KTJ37207.1 peptidase [Klebsiella aerogenes]